MAAHIDHLVVASNDLVSLARWWLDASGEAASPGGAHVGRGTRNELVGLGASTYLELIGPDLAQPDHEGQRSFGVDQLKDGTPVLSTFALAADDLDEARARYTAAGIDTSAPFAMERITPDGQLLAWRLSLPLDGGYNGTVPFLIEWGQDTEHPAASLSHRSRLARLSIQFPNPAMIEAALGPAGADIDVLAGPARLEATFDTPSGPVDVHSRLIGGQMPCP